MRKACGLAGQVYVYTYSGSSADIWWRQNRDALRNLDRLVVRQFPAAAGNALEKFVRRSMQLQCTIQDAQAWLTDGITTIQVSPSLRSNQ